MKTSARRFRHSQSLANLRQRPSQAIVRSMIALRQHDELAQLGSLDDLEVDLAASRAHSGLKVGALIPAVGVELQ
jgi:hypothetical protein